MILLVIAYTLLSISIFLGILCLKKNIETWETIALMFSLLLLIISSTAETAEKVIRDNPNPNEPTDVFILLAMVLVGLATPLNVMAERRHNLSSFWKKVLYSIAAILFVATIIGFFTNTLDYLQYAASLFLGVSVIASMVLIRVTKPQKRLQHIEKLERIFALIFLLVVPLSLFINFINSEVGQTLKVGFTLPLVFILISANKIWDDLQRLSILKSNVSPNEQHFKNFFLTEREKEIAKLLTKGKTYKQISEELFISLPTVKTHTSNMYKKLKVKNKHELIVMLMN
ncbi:regulatory protein, luxR family [Flagellimonas pacifica]|uniref:Regulatory protein, luxR family n=2 Tax=Flagellimonas pacifica TaxID=1247520 RepID=A0A285MCX6_9FLAO|nr:regulatory protein, luxR family [Allomuricauda parva]